MTKDRTLISRLATVLIFTTSGILHFANERFYTPMVPKGIGDPRAIVQISGAAELAGAVGVLIPGTRKLAGKGLIALLIAVFPANINMAINPERFKQFPAWALWARLPLQFVAIVMVWRGTQQAD